MKFPISKILSLPPLASLKKRLVKSHLMKRFSHGVYWTLAGNLVWRVLSAVSSIAVARILGPKAFGEFGMIFSTINMFSVYAGFRLGTTATKYVSEHRKKDPGKAARILKLTMTVSFLLCALVALGLFVFSRHLAANVLDHPGLATGLALGALLLFFLVYGEVKLHALAGFESFKAIAKVNIFRGVMTPLVCIPAAYVWGVEGLIASLALVAVLMFSRASVFLKREKANANLPDSVSLSEARREMPVLWKFALPGFLAGLLITSMMWVGRLLLTQRDSGFSELGIFEAANQWRALILFLPAILVRVMLPILSETYGRESKNDFGASISMQIQSVCLVSLPLVILIIGLSEPLALIYGRHFAGVETIIPVLMIAVFFDAMNQSVRQIYDSTGRRWTNLGMYAVWAAVFLLGCLVYIPRFGALGFALAHLTAEAVLLVIQSLYVDLVLAPAVLRRHARLLIFSVSLIGLSYIAHDALPASWGIPAISGLFLLGLMPFLRKLRSAK